jgi:hypothetical protein
LDALPPLVAYPTEDEYRQHFRRVYCHGPIMTFDGIAVRFRAAMFDHCFFESVVTKDDSFSLVRAERIDWIAATLQDPNAELFVGWDSVKKRPATNRRVALVSGDYVTVIQMQGAGKATFITALVASTPTFAKVRGNGRWK